MTNRYTLTVMALRELSYEELLAFAAGQSIILEEVSTLIQPNGGEIRIALTDPVRENLEQASELSHRLARRLKEIRATLN
jgi:hypothetical protein